MSPILKISAISIPALALLYRCLGNCQQKAMNDNFRELLTAWVAVTLYLGMVWLLASRALFNRWVKGLGGDPDFLSVIVLFPSATFSTRLGALSFLKLISATISVFQIKQVALTCDLNLLDAAVRNRTRENGDSTTFDVRRCFQCSRGKS